MVGFDQILNGQLLSLGATRSALGPEENSEASQTSKMELLAKIVRKNSITKYPSGVCFHHWLWTRIMFCNPRKRPIHILV